jgi:uncharacterized protein (TIGR00730 family)
MAALRSTQDGGGNPGGGRPKTLCVFCGSQVGNDRRYAAAAERLGKLLAEQRVRLVYGGGGIGLMGVLARSVLQAGGLAVGVVPGFLRQLEVQQQGLTELVVTETMHERKFLMYDMADAFAVLPGGIGTLEEITELVSWRHLGVHVKPIVLIDVANYWQPFVELIEHAVSEGFAAEAVRRDFGVVARVEDVLPAVGLAAPVAPIKA